MRILIDIGHPAHVHLFRPFAKEMARKGNKLLFTYRRKEYEENLLDAEGFDKICFGKHYKSKAGKIIGLIKFNFLMFFNILKFKPNFVLSHGSIYAAQMAWIAGKIHISLEDSGNMEQIRLYLPFTKAVITPDILPEKLGKKQITYRGYHELFYLHPKYFKPERTILERHGISPDEKYVVLRFVSFRATHDYGHAGLTNDEKESIIQLIQQRYKVYISSEYTLPAKWKKYQIGMPPHLIHHLLYFASLVVSEGATLASEAGVLGTPSIYINSISRSYNEDQEKYGLVYNFREGINVPDKIIEILNNEANINYKTRKDSLLADKISPTDFLVWFIENYPASYHRAKKYPGISLGFQK